MFIFESAKFHDHGYFKEKGSETPWKYTVVCNYAVGGNLAGASMYAQGKRVAIDKFRGLNFQFCLENSQIKIIKNDPQIQKSAQQIHMTIRRCRLKMSYKILFQEKHAVGVLRTRHATQALGFVSKSKQRNSHTMHGYNHM